MDPHILWIEAGGRLVGDSSFDRDRSRLSYTEITLPVFNAGTKKEGVGRFPQPDSTIYSRAW